MERNVPPIHGPDHVPGGPDPIPLGDAIFEIKVFEDDEVVVAGDGAFKFAIPEDLDTAVLTKAEAWVTEESSSGDVIVSIQNGDGGPDLLTDPLTIDAGERNSKDSASPYTVDTANNVVAWGDELWINVDNAGTGALGLGVALYFLSAGVAAIVVRGAKGDPGGVTEFDGDWDSGSVDYPAGSVVVHDGVAYLSLEDHTSDAGTEPGTVGGDAVWTPIVDIPVDAAVTVTVLSSAGAVPDGVKGVAVMPFDATITEATILADVAGDAVIDVWKSDYAGYPPDASDTICGSSPPTLTGSIKNTDVTLTGWTTSLVEGDILLFAVSDAVDVKRLSIVLRFVR